MVVVFGSAAGLQHTGDGPADSGFLRDKTAVFRDTLRGTVCTIPGSGDKNHGNQKLAVHYPTLVTKAISFAVRKPACEDSDVTNNWIVCQLLRCLGVFADGIKRPIHFQLNGEILLCDVIPDEKIE
jgi:hypothetical protein